MSEIKSTETVSDEKETQNDKIAKLEAQVEQLMALLKIQMGDNGSRASSAPSVTDTIKIVHLVERAPGLKTLIHLGNGTVITMTKFGEERTLSIPQFEEILGKYRGWFDMGMIAIHKDYEDKAKYYMMDTAAQYPINSDFFREIKKKSMADIESVYPRLPKAGQDSLCSYWHRMAREGDRHFADIRNLETMNRLSDGAFTQLIAEINAKNNKH